MLPLQKKNINKKCIDLRKLRRASIYQLQQIGLRRIPVQFELFEKEWSFSFKKISFPEKGLLQIFIDWGGARCLFRTSSAVTDELIAQVLGIDCVIGSNPLANVAIFDAAFFQFSELIEAVTRKRFIFISSDYENFPDWASHGFSILLDNGNIETHFECWLDDVGLGFFAVAIRDLEKFPVHSKFTDDLPIPLFFVAGRSSVACEEFLGVEKHDVILLDECFVGIDGIIHINVGKACSFKAKIEGTTVEIIDGIKKNVMKDIVKDGDEDELHDVNNLEVNIEFDLGAQTVALSELKMITPGYVFDLGRDIRKSVTIRANGKIIGTGELVDVEGFTGVSVLSFLDKF